MSGQVRFLAVCQRIRMHTTTPLSRGLQSSRIEYHFNKRISPRRHYYDIIPSYCIEFTYIPFLQHHRYQKCFTGSNKILLHCTSAVISFTNSYPLMPLKKHNRTSKTMILFNNLPRVISSGGSNSPVLRFPSISDKSANEFSGEGVGEDISMPIGNKG